MWLTVCRFTAVGCSKADVVQRGLAEEGTGSRERREEPGSQVRHGQALLPKASQLPEPAVSTGGFGGLWVWTVAGR